jgi:winged helix DNA-binding protein
MARAVDPVLLERAARHGFAARGAADARAAVRVTTAIQAQDGAAALLGVRARSAGLTEAEVLAAIAARQVVRSWFMRATIQLVDAADATWLAALYGPFIERRFRKRWLDLGLTSSLLTRCHDALPGILADGPRTRAQIVTALGEHGIAIPDADPQTAAHVLVSATARGLLCRADDVGRNPRFTLMAQWLPSAPSGPRGDDALAELARRYFAAFSPAAAADFTAWSGLPSRRAVDLIRDELDNADVHGRPGFRLGSVDAKPNVALLPAFDNYLVGYRHRDEMLSPALHPLVYVGGLIKPTLVVNGHITGFWKLNRQTGKAQLHLTLFEELSRKHRSALEREADDVSRFLSQPISLTIATD